jgi:uncharacterized lipoprotein
MKPTVSALLLVILTSGCATAPVQRHFDRTTHLQDVEFDQAWNAIIDLFGERNWTIANMERASGFINSDWMTVPPNSDYLDCGSPGMMVDSQHQGRFNVIVRDEPGRPVGVTINSTWRASRRLGSNPPSIVECFSTGVLERQLHRQLSERFGAS